LTSTIDFYNLHQSITKLDEKPLTVIVGYVRYTRNVQMLRRRYELEKGYGKTIYRFFNFSKIFFFFKIHFFPQICIKLSFPRIESVGE
jgi:hypothetical protein